MSKAVKTIVGVAAMIAIPYFAPMIAGSTALAGVSSAIGTTATSALVGAGLGAAKGAVLGEDIGRSALMGGLSGGISGYMQPAGVAGGAAGGTGLTPSVSAAAAPGSQYALTGGGGTGLTTGGTGAAGLSFGGQTAGTLGGTAAGAAGGTGLGGAFTDYSLASAPAAANYGLTPDYSLAAATAPAAGAGAGGAGAAATPGTFSEALRAKFTDPKNMADFTLRAAGQLAGSALAGSGLSDEEQALLNQQTEELRNLQQTNQSLFNQRLEQAQSLIGESRYFDPEYFGLQSARRQQVAGAQQRRAGLRGLTGEARASAGRKYDLGTARNVATAYDTGFQSAIGPRLQTMQAGLSALPTSGPSNAAGYAALQDVYSGARKNQRQTQADIGTLFGSLTGRSS